MDLEEMVNIKVDGKSDEDLWANAFGVEFDGYRIKTVVDQDNLYVLLNFLSTDPMRNPFENEGIFNGDALEIAFSSNPDLQKKRKHSFL